MNLLSLPGSSLCTLHSHTVWIVIVVQVFGSVIHIVVGPSIVGLSCGDMYV